VPVSALMRLESTVKVIIKVMRTTIRSVTDGLIFMRFPH
jgi:hypothetical protein